MSKIPRAGSPDRALPDSITLKRKASDDENPVPAKIPTMAGRVLKPSLISNLQFNNRAHFALGPRSPYNLNKPQPSLASTITQRSKRSVSAPPTKSGAVISTLSKSSLFKPGTLVDKFGPIVDERLEESSYHQVESARAADIAKGSYQTIFIQTSLKLSIK